VGAYAHEDKAVIEAAAITATRFARIFSNSGIKREGSGFKISKWSSWSSPPHERRLGQARRRGDVFPVPKPFLKACFVIMEDNRFALGGFDRQALLLGLLREVDQRLAAEAAAVRFNRRTEINPTRHLSNSRQQFAPRSVWYKGLVFADPVDADSANRDREQHDQADQDEPNVDVPRDGGHQEQRRGNEDVQQHLRKAPLALGPQPSVFRGSASSRRAAAD
jgi:hypothetical protein